MIAGQAKSHCVAWTIDDLLSDPNVRERGLEEKVYLLEDCTSPVVVPGSVDYTDEADAAFARFAESGAHLVRSDVPMRDWPGVVGESSRAGSASTSSSRSFGRYRRPTFADGSAVGQHDVRR